MEIRIAPSLLSADFTRLGEDVASLHGADYLHLDIMDGNFVPNISFGPLVVEALRPESDLVFDTHLMIEGAESFIQGFARAGSDIITVHVEACAHLHRMLQEIRDHGVKAGVSLNPGTPLASVEEVLHLADHMLLMTVNPGFGGQEFLPEVLTKIRRAAALREERSLEFDIGVDGGINLETAPLVVEAGANVLVSGSTVFGAGDRAEVISRLRRVAEEAGRSPAPGVG